MIISEEELQERIESPLNLMNRLRAITKAPIEIPTFPTTTPTTSTTPTTPIIPSPKAEDLVNNLEDKINIGSLRTRASSIMVDAMSELKIRVTEAKTPKELALIAGEMNKIVNAPVNNTNQDNRTQVIIYSPRTRSEEDFDTITVSE
jgi:hypothetical protein